MNTTNPRSPTKSSTRDTLDLLINEVCRLVKRPKEGMTMPVKVTKKPGGKYKVETPNMVHAKGTTKAKAESQERLLNAIEHGLKPTKGKRK